MIPKDERRCSKCLTLTGWLGWVPRGEIVLALILSIISMVAAVVPPAVRWWNNRSVTQARIVGVEDQEVMADGLPASVPMIRVDVTNTGTRPSFVRSATISFTEGLRIVAMPLEILEVRERYVRPDETSFLHLTARKYVAKNLDPTTLKDNSVTVTLQVEETLRLGGRGVEPRLDTVPAIDIERWITHGAQ